MNEASLLKVIKYSKVTGFAATCVDAVANIYIRVSKTLDQSEVNAKLSAKVAELEGKQTPIS